MPDPFKVKHPESTWKVIYDNSEALYVMAEFRNHDDALRYRDLAVRWYDNGATWTVVKDSETVSV